MGGGIRGEDSGEWVGGENGIGDGIEDERWWISNGEYVTVEEWPSYLLDERGVCQRISALSSTYLVGAPHIQFSPAFLLLHSCICIPSIAR